jgi:hypothetical protein
MATAARKSAPKAAPPKKRADWDAIERDYRTAQFTTRELESKHGVSHSLIARNAKKKGWTQDLAQAIKQATNAKLIDELVNSEVHKGSQQVHNAVEAAAEVNKNVILGHRNGLSRITNIKSQLLEQIEQAAANMTGLAEVIEMVRSPDDNGQDRANDALKRAMGRSALVDDLKKLADVDEKVRKGEREAFSIESGASTDDDDSMGKLMALVSGSKLPISTQR